MQTKTIELYEYDELSPEAQEKAREWYNESSNCENLEYDIKEELKSILDDENISYDVLKVYYSLTHCQGDGAMFAMIGSWKGYNITVKQDGRYYHYNSKTIDITDENGEWADDAVCTEFNELYVKICKEIEKYGYQLIEASQEEETVADNIRVNGYTFTKDGKRENL